MEIFFDGIVDTNCWGKIKGFKLPPRAYQYQIILIFSYLKSSYLRKRKLSWGL